MVFAVSQTLAEIERAFLVGGAAGHRVGGAGGTVAGTTSCHSSRNGHSSFDGEQLAALHRIVHYIMKCHPFGTLRSRSNDIIL